MIWFYYLVCFIAVTGTASVYGLDINPQQPRMRVELMNKTSLNELWNRYFQNWLDDSNEDINLLAAVGSPFPPDVRAVTGPFGRYGRPAVEFTPKSYVGRWAKDLLPVPFFRDFGIKVSLFLQSAFGGVVFSVLEYNHSKSILALNILQLNRGRQAIEFTYRNAQGSEETRDLVATFEVPRMDRRWSVFSITVQGQTVTLYFSGCDKVMTKVFTRKRYDLALRDNSPIFIGNAGWYIQKPALYGAIYDLTIYKNFQDAVPKCHQSREPEFARNEKVGTEGNENNLVGGPTIINEGNEGNTRGVLTQQTTSHTITSTTKPTTTTTTTSTTTTKPTTTTTRTPTTTTTTTMPITATTTTRPTTTTTTTTPTTTTTTMTPATTTTTTTPAIIIKTKTPTTTTTTTTTKSFPATTETEASTVLPEMEIRTSTPSIKIETEDPTMIPELKTSTNLPELETEKSTILPQTETPFPTISPETEIYTRPPNFNSFTEEFTTESYQARENVEKEKRRKMSDPTPTPYPADHTFSTVLDLYSTKTPTSQPGIDQLKYEVQQELKRIRESLRVLTGDNGDKDTTMEPATTPYIPSTLKDNEALEETRKELFSEIRKINTHLETVKDEMMRKEAERLDKINPKSGGKFDQKFSGGGLCNEEKVRNIVMEMMDRRMRNLRTIAKGPLGFPGEPGEPGERGEKGSKGEPGQQGTIGIIGSKGSKGEPGPRGLQGNQGEYGEKGEKGDAGEEGDQGDQGKIGRTGEKGRKGEMGERGIQGIQGKRGEDGIKGEPGVKGDRGLIGLSGETGRKGEPGERGVPGKPGEKGDDGEPGRKGEQGSDGIKGGKGDVGPMGPNGTNGLSGEKGEKGSIGRTGFGIKGEKGNQGETIQGRPGPKGEQGQKGNEGSIGPIGIPGPQGSKGSTGDFGPRGLKGEKGASSAASPARANVILNMKDLVLMKDLFNIGSIAFVTSTNSLFVKSLHGWLQVETVQSSKTPLELSPLSSNNEIVDTSNQVVSGPTLTTSKPTTTTTTPIVKPTKAKPNLYLPPVGINAKHPYLILAALNQPQSGRMGGIPAIDSMCAEQATKSGYYSIKFQAFISDDFNEIKSMIFYKYRDLPVANTRGEQIFPSVRSIYNKKKYGIFNPDLPIYSFDQRDVRRDNAWPVKMIWHGSHADGRSHAKNKHCQNWRADVPAFRGTASSIMEHLPALNEVEMRCDRKLIVLCLQIR